MWKIELLTSPGHTYAAQKGLKAGNNNLGQHKWERFPLQQATNGATVKNQRLSEGGNPKS